MNIFDIMRIPYYNVLITRDGEVIGKKQIRISKTRAKYFRVPKYRSVFILPDIKKMKGTPPIRNRSGILLVYDVKNAFPLRVVNYEGLEQILEEETQTAINPTFHVREPVNPEELHEFLEAKVTEDIMSSDEKSFPMWLVFLIAIAIIAVMLLGVTYMVTHGGALPPTEIINPIMNVTPTPTPGYIITP